MIYLDSSVVLAQIFLEARQPTAMLWSQAIASSRLLEYEVWNRIFARGLGHGLQDEVGAVLRKVGMIELGPQPLRRALRPFPIAVRTLDALHLATMVFLLETGEAVQLASYDNRLLSAAAALGIPAAEL